MAAIWGFFSGFRTAHALDWPRDRDAAKPCRPTITCTADILYPGDLEIEVGGAFARGDSLRQWTFPFLLKLGVAPWLEADVGSNGYTLVLTQPHGDYLDNLVFGPKFHLTDQQSIVPSLSVSAEVGVPTLADSGYTRNDDLFFVAYASKDLGPLHVDWNVGLTVWRLNDDLTAQLYTSLVLSTALPVNLGVEAEGYIFSDAGSAASRDGGFRAALTFTPRPWIVLDAGGDAGMYPSTRSYTVFGGVTVVPVAFWRPMKDASRSTARSPAGSLGLFR